MGIRKSGQTVYLNELKGELLALRYLGRDTTVTGEFGPQDAAVASVVHFTRGESGLSARLLGETLVFQRAVQSEIRGSSDWSVGVFEEVNRPLPNVPNATMYQLTEPDEEIEVIIEAMEQANITV